MAHRDAERISRERPAAKGGAGRSERIHDVAAPAERGQRKTATHAFSERGEIGSTAGLRAGETETQPRDHFIEDDERTMAARSFKQAVEKAGLREHQSHVADDRLDGDRRQHRLASRELLVDVGEVVVARDDRLGANAGRNSAAQRVARLRRRAGIVQRRVEMTVIVSRKPQDERPLGEGASHAQGAHHRLGSGVDESQTLHRRQMSRDPFGKTYLVLVRRAEDAAACRKCIEARNQGRMRVTEQERSVGHHVIDVCSTVAIVGVRAAPAHLHERRAADRRAATYRRTCTARERAVERDHAREVFVASKSRLHARPRRDAQRRSRQ